MRPIQGFENVQAIHGRQGALPGGPYVMVIVRAKEDMTGYGNECLKVVYDICEGQFAGRFADLAGDEEQDWRHEVEIDLKEANGARLRAFVDAVQASNPGYTWDWNEAGLAGKFVGIVLQERKVTLTRGKNKGKDRTYLDLWDCVPVDAVRQGAVPTPPVNDKREAKQEQQAPVVAPSGYQHPQTMAAQQPMQIPQQQPQPMPQQPMAAPQVAPQPMQQQYQQPMVQMPAQGYGQPMQGYPQQMPAQQKPDLYDEDIPF